MMRRLTSRALAAPAVATALRAQALKVPPRMPLHKHDNFLSGTNADYLDSLYDMWEANPASVHESVAELFRNANARQSGEVPIYTETRRLVDEESLNRPVKVGIQQTVQESRQLISLIQAHERHGHLFARLDPLQYERGSKRVPSQKHAMRMNLHPTAFGFTEADFDRTFCVGFHDGVGGLFDANTGPMSLRQMYDRVKRAYTGTIGYEFMHIYDEKVLHWLRERIECPSRVDNNPLATELSSEDRKSLYGTLASAVEFELFLKTKFQTTKRFGSDGAESFLVGMDSLIERATSHGVEEVVLGMAHRGRLSVLHHVCGKPLEALLREFKGIQPQDVPWAEDYGDVKYHRGFRSERKLRNGKVCAVELLNNPSHLETVNPVVQGYSRAAQVERDDGYGHRVLPVEIHGDAAFAGQGIVFETMGLASIGKFRTGGTVHVVVNNQLGFTTPPVESRSSTHCSDVGRIFQCPVFHVNGDCVEDVHRVFQLAADYRATFNKSVIIDLVTYRRFGHNEGDTPHFTQPMLYKVIDKRPNVLELYTTQLAAETQNSVPAPDLAAIRAETKQKLSGAWKVIDNPENYSYADFQRSCVRDVWRPFMPSLNEAKMLPTAVTKEQLEPVIRALKTLPKGYTLHKNLEKIFANRSDSLTAGNAIEWGTAEALAFGTLLQEGYPVRISGQDVERATFSQRHAVYHDQKDDSTYTQLCNIDPAQANFTVTNSSLSEYGVLGFEVGYAVRHPKNMVMWEAQFADFANGAQIMIDQYITSSETKWRLPSSVILSMPHGNDGNGPEHSSGRIERFLQANTEVDVLPEMSVVERHWRGGVEVAFPTTPKQYFHLLRRHMLRNFRKPLVSFFSKSFLRAPNTSSIDELVTGEFVPLLDAKEYSVPQDKVRRVIYTCGQVYHMLAARIKKEKINDIALVRFEQLAPFPLTELKHSLASFPNAEVWFAQEEPKNMGSFSYAEPHMLRALDYSKPVNFAGRLAGPSPATGYVSIWKHEQEAIVKTALGL